MAVKIQNLSSQMLLKL